MPLPGISRALQAEPVQSHGHPRSSAQRGLRAPGLARTLCLHSRLLSAPARRRCGRQRRSCDEAAPAKCGRLQGPRGRVLTALFRGRACLESHPGKMRSHSHITPRHAHKQGMPNIAQKHPSGPHRFTETIRIPGRLAYRDGRLLQVHWTKGAHYCCPGAGAALRRNSSLDLLHYTKSESHRVTSNRCRRHLSLPPRAACSPPEAALERPAH